MSLRIAAGYVGLLFVVGLAWQLGAIPGWVAGLVLVASALLLMTAAWFGFTRRDEGRHALEAQAAPHRDPSFTLSGLMARWMWRDNETDTTADTDSLSLPETIERSRGNQ